VIFQKILSKNTLYNVNKSYHTLNESSNEPPQSNHEDNQDAFYWKSKYEELTEILAQKDQLLVDQRHFMANAAHDLKTVSSFNCLLNLLELSYSSLFFVF
jgi:hypothetical protein